jgi:hypothetical protein
MPVDPTIAPLLAAASAAPAATDIETVRAGLRQTAAIVAPNPPVPVHSVTDRAVPGRAGEIPVGVYGRRSARRRPWSSSTGAAGRLGGGRPRKPRLLRPQARR